MTKVLVTGASGFIGAHLAARLAARGDDVTCLVRKTSNVEPLKALGVRLAFGDVSDVDSLRTAMAGQHIVYHLAGCTKTLKDRQFYEINRRGTTHVGQACAGQTTPPVLVFVSSLAAAGPAIDGNPRVESDPPEPVSHYGRSKRGGEHALESYAHRVPTTIVRPPIVLGQGDRAGLPLFRSVIRFGVHLSPGLKSQRFSLIHADDLVQLIILAAERGKRLPPLGQNGDSRGQGYYFAACEVDPTYADLGRLVAEAGGRRVLVIPTAMPVVRTIVVVGEAISHLRHQPLLMNLDKGREISAGSWLCSAQAAKNDLGFAVAAPLLDRLRQTADWYRNEGWL